MQKEEIINSLKEKLGDKIFNKAEIIANERFGDKNRLKIKFYQSILEGHINPSELWTDDSIISSLKSKIDSVDDSEKEALILNIIDTYNVSDPKIKALLRKYDRYLRKIKSDNDSNKITI